MSSSARPTSDLVIVTELWHERGGGRERYAAELVASLRDQGLRPQVLCLRVGDSAILEPVVCGPGRNGERRRDTALEDFRRRQPAAPVLALAPIHRASHYQLHSGLHRDSFRAEHEAMRSPLRRAFYPLGLRLNRRRQRLLRAEEELLRNTAGPRLMVFSAQLEDDLIEHFPGVASRIRRARLGVDRTLFRPLSMPTDQHRDRRRLLFAGHNYALKGLAPLLEAVAALRSVGVHLDLVVVGGDRAGPFARHAAELGIASAVRFLGDVDQNRLADLYRSSDATVINSFYDPAPRVLLEALSCGCPVIASRRVGGAELIQPGRQGEIVDEPRDPRAVAAAIRRLYSVPPSGRRQSAAAVGAGFDFAAHAQAVQKWLFS